MHKESFKSRTKSSKNCTFKVKKLESNKSLFDDVYHINQELNKLLFQQVKDLPQDQQQIQYFYSQVEFLITP